MAQTIATTAFAQQPAPPDGPRTSCPDGDDPDAACSAYQRDPISARLAYNWRDDYATSFSETGAQPSAIYVAPVESLDFQLNYDVNPRMTLSLKATNLLGKATKNYFGDECLYPRDVGSPERTISLFYASACNRRHRDPTRHPVHDLPISPECAFARHPGANRRSFTTAAGWSSRPRMDDQPPAAITRLTSSAVENHFSLHRDDERYRSCPAPHRRTRNKEIPRCR
ncbi:hypothetical protein [Luteimonas salinilitoris]|uniref:TonB-dependent receptor n=1 Tax=Luteimonas salinilitoris TaxID=3237697 RepID=A0ABV4HK49_9GAMM